MSESDDVLDINCGRCGKSFGVANYWGTWQVFVVFDLRTDNARSD